MRTFALALLVACAHRGPTEAVAPAAPVDAVEIVDGALGERPHGYLEGVERYGMSGVALVAHEGRVVLRSAHGLAVRDPRRPLTVDTPLILGSLSKQFTAAAILRLATDGRLSLADPLARFFPDAPADKRDITVEQLLVHTSGLPYLEDDFLEQLPRDLVMQDMLALPLEFAPGERHAYSSPGYTLLAGIVEAASGESFEAYARRTLFDPAGMADTGFMGEPRWASAPPVHSYAGDDDEGAMPDFPPLPKGVGAGHVISTVDDLWRWHVALRDGVVLPPEQVEAFYAPRVAAGPPNVRYGYGWNVVDTPRGRIVGHAGDLGGYNADMRYYVDRDLVVVFLSNARPSGPGWRQAVVNNLSLLAAGEPYAAPPDLAELPDGALDPWAGAYALPSGDRIDAWVDDDALILGATGQAAISLLVGAPPETEAIATSLSDRARAIASATASGDYGPLREALSPSLPFDGVGEALDAARAEAQADLGPFVGVEVLGTAVRSPATAETWYTLRFERGEILARFGWVGGQIMAMDTDLDRPPSTRFLPEAADRVVTFDPFTGATVRVSLVADGGTLALRIGDVLAGRVPG